jgi:phosphopantothenoylcysteine decarboxylase/phosphopantothenate--cysteine ligase
VQRGVQLDVILTDDAQRFIGVATFAALAQRPVWTSLWERSEMIPHIRLVRENDVLAIVPATANTIAKLANGIADDLLTNAALAARIPIVVAPAMNSAMLDHAATVENLRTLAARGVTIVAPESGFLAERESGAGRLANEDAIVAAIEAALVRMHDLAGERVMITAGPTREAIDPVRFLSNASTGTMGIELAHEALARGACVELILGPTLVPPPSAADVVRVTTAAEMADAAFARAPHATAAVADWRPAHASATKVKKTDAVVSLALERTTDILADLGARKNGTYLVGFAAETDAHEANAREKLVRKHLDMIAVNDVSNDGGFGIGENAITLLWGTDGRRDLGRGSKRVLAARLWDTLVSQRAARD